MELSITRNSVIALTGIIGLLVVATFAVVTLRARLAPNAYQELVQRIRSWWVIIIAFVVAIALTRTVTLVFFAFVSFLALKEYLSLIPARRVDRRAMFWAYLMIPAQYALIGYEWYGMFIILIPVYAFLLLPARMVLIGETDNFLRSASILHWGLMATVFSLSHIAYLLVLPQDVNPGAGGAGLVVFLVFLTQFNDVAQYLWGKSVGRHKALPTVSPGKTVEGFFGGALTTTVAAWILGGWLTPLTSLQSLAGGLLVGVAGFVGDTIISALKRDLGVKDSGNLLPGHGGILDRVDSLVCTAPLFFHFVYYLHY